MKNNKKPDLYWIRLLNKLTPGKFYLELSTQQRQVFSAGFWHGWYCYSALLHSGSYTSHLAVQNAPQLNRPPVVVRYRYHFLAPKTGCILISIDWLLIHFAQSWCRFGMTAVWMSRFYHSYGRRRGHLTCRSGGRAGDKARAFFAEKHGREGKTATMTIFSALNSLNNG